MPCYTKVQTLLLDISSIEAAADQLGITVVKHSATYLTLKRGSQMMELTRENDKAKFQATGATEMLDELLPTYAKKQLVKFAKSKGYTVSQGGDASEFVLTKYE